MGFAVELIAITVSWGALSNLAVASVVHVSSSPLILLEIPARTCASTSDFGWREDGLGREGNWLELELVVLKADRGSFGRCLRRWPTPGETGWGPDILYPAGKDQKITHCWTIGLALIFGSDRNPFTVRMLFITYLLIFLLQRCDDKVTSYEPGHLKMWSLSIHPASTTAQHWMGR